MIKTTTGEELSACGIWSVRFHVHNGAVREASNVKHITTNSYDLILFDRLDYHGCTYEAQGGV